MEVGAALARNKRIVPICHTDLKTTQLQRPLSDYQSFNASDTEGLQALYASFALEIGSATPLVDFEKLAEKVREFETRHREDKGAMMAAADAGNSTESTDVILPRPRVLCISSKQF